jgi:hypothetical protein
MHNDPELNGKYLGSITKDFALVSDLLKEACYQCHKRGISDYPIVTVSKETLPFGAAIIERGYQGVQWNFGLSMMEEFLQRKLISTEAEPDFISTFKNLDEFCCCFVVDKDFLNFVYIPYPED